MGGGGSFSPLPQAPGTGMFQYPYNTGKAGKSFTDYLLYGLEGQKGQGLVKQGKNWITPEYLQPRPEYPGGTIAPRDPAVEAAIAGRTQNFMETPDINYFRGGSQWGGGSSPGQFLQQLFQTGMPVTTQPAKGAALSDWQRQLGESLAGIRESFGGGGNAFSSGLADIMGRTARDSNTQFNTFWEGQALDEARAALQRRREAVGPLSDLTKYQDTGQNLEKIAQAYGLEAQGRSVQQEFINADIAEKNRRFPEYYSGQSGLQQLQSFLAQATPQYVPYQQVSGTMNPTMLQTLLPMLGGLGGMLGGGSGGGGMAGLSSLLGGGSGGGGGLAGLLGSGAGQAGAAGLGAAATGLGALAQILPSLFMI